MRSSIKTAARYGQPLRGSAAVALDAAGAADETAEGGVDREGGELADVSAEGGGRRRPGSPRRRATCRRQVDEERYLQWLSETMREMEEEKWRERMERASAASEQAIGAEQRGARGRPSS